MIDFSFMEQRYREWLQLPTGEYAEFGRMMLDLIAYLRNEHIVNDKEAKNGGHDTLALIDSHIAHKFVSVRAWMGRYQIQHSLPPEYEPWEYTVVIGSTTAVGEAAAMIRQAFEWKPRRLLSGPPANAQKAFPSKYFAAKMERLLQVYRPILDALHRPSQKEKQGFIGLLQHLQRHPLPDDVECAVNLETLRLILAPEYDRKCYVALRPVYGDYYIEYALRDDEGAWPNARVRGPIHDLDVAMQIIYRIVRERF